MKIPMSQLQEDIERNKRELRLALVSFRNATGHLDCGSTLARYVSPEADKHARRANEIAAWLQKHDLNFPASWVPL